MNLMRYRSVLYGEVVAVEEALVHPHFRAVAHRPVPVCIHVRFAIDPLPAIVLNSIKSHVRKRTNNGVYLIRLNNDWKELRRHPISVKEKVAEADPSQPNLKYISCILLIEHRF
jgi:hypothetical protein